MTQLTILTPAEKRQLDSPPQFTQQDRQRYFFMSGQLRSIVSRIRRQDNKIGFVLQWGYFCSRARFYPADQFKQRDIAYVKRLFKCDDVDLSGNRNIWLICQVHRGSILLHTGRTDCLKGFPLANIPSVRYCSFFLTRKIKYE